MDSSSALNVTSLVGLAFAAAVGALITWFDRRKAKKTPETDGEAQGRVLAASMVDTRAIRDAVKGLGNVIESIDRFSERQHRDSLALRETIEDMTSAVKKNTDAQEGGAVTPRDMMDLLSRMDRSGK